MPKDVTFWEMVEKMEIIIPPIQRDYAQGRESEKVKRENFLNVLKNALTSDKVAPLHLDFVYGRKNTANSQADEGKTEFFIPIDGQQRLTTLMLLHWYAAKVDTVSKEECAYLKSFSYETRVSSREFCKRLHQKEISIPLTTEDNELKKAIQSKVWFRSAWNNDPTISAMLNMIQAIHDKFHGEKGLWNKLVEERSITFHLFVLRSKNFSLTDELYIKMNSRGKPLSYFENFKAEFIGFLGKHEINNDFKTYKDLPQPDDHNTVKDLPDDHNTGKSLETPCAHYFSLRFEREWTDLFWSFRSEDNSIDSQLENYFEFITKYCFFRNKKDAKAEDFKTNDFSIYETTYKNKKNLLFLFQSLNLLCTLSKKGGGSPKENLSAFFEQVFTNEELVDNPDGKINLCRTSASDEISKNIFSEALPGKGALKVKGDILVFCLIYYMIHFSLSEATQGLRNFLRVIRNLLSSLRSRSEIVYSSDLRVNDFHGYWLLFEQLLSQKDEDVMDMLRSAPPLSTTNTKITVPALEEEKSKAKLFDKDNENIRFKLEELSIFEGLIQQLYCGINPDRVEPAKLHQLNSFYEALRHIWGNGAEEVRKERLRLAIRALIACGFEGIYNKDSSTLGALYSYGGTEQKYWSRILAASSDEKNESGNAEKSWTNETEVIAGKALRLMLSQYTKYTGTPEKRLKEIIAAGLNESIVKADGTPVSVSANCRWRYYFLKYDGFTISPEKNFLYYTWKDDESYNMQILRSDSVNPVGAYHFSVYAWAVIHEVDGEIKEETTNQLKCSKNDSIARGGTYPPLALVNGVKMYSIKEGWRIDISDIKKDVPKWSCIKKLIKYKGEEEDESTCYLLPASEPYDKKNETKSTTPEVDSSEQINNKSSYPDMVKVAVDFINDLFSENWENKGILDV